MTPTPCRPVHTDPCGGYLLLLSVSVGSIHREFIDACRTGGTSTKHRRQTTDRVYIYPSSRVYREQRHNIRFSKGIIETGFKFFNLVIVFLSVSYLRYRFVFTKHLIGETYRLRTDIRSNSQFTPKEGQRHDNKDEPQLFWGDSEDHVAKRSK